MTNIIYIMIESMIQTDPFVAYLFFALVIAGTAMTYLYKKEAGFAATIAVSAMAGYADILYPFIYGLTAACSALLILSLIGRGSIMRPVKNLESWAYLKLMLRKRR